MRSTDLVHGRHAFRAFKDTVRELVKLQAREPDDAARVAKELCRHGSYTVPSTGGGQDSVTTMFRLSPGERVDFTPAGGAPQGQAAAGAPTNVQVHVVDQRDQRGLLRSPDDVIRVVLDDMGKNPGKYRSLLPTR